MSHRKQVAPDIEDDGELFSGSKPVVAESRRSSRKSLPAQKNLEEDFRKDELAESLASDARRLGAVLDWIATHVKGDSQTIYKILDAVPEEMFNELLGVRELCDQQRVVVSEDQKHAAAEKCLEEMLQSAKARLDGLKMERLTTNYFETRWGKLDDAKLRQECANRELLADEGRVGRDGMIKLLCVDDRKKILKICVDKDRESCFEMTGSPEKLPRAEQKKVDAIAFHLTVWNGKKSYSGLGSSIIEAPLPSFEYLDTLFKSKEVLLKEFDRLEKGINDAKKEEKQGKRRTFLLLLLSFGCQI